MVARDEPVIAFTSRTEWAEWLAREHGTATGVWVQLAKKGSGLESVAYADAVEEALCYGWIDSQARSSDDPGRWLQRFTPRTRRSKWSQINCERATALIEAGRMQPAGLQQVEAAKADGRWDAAYAPPSTATVPDDLQAALDADPTASAFFATLDSRNRYAILHRIQDAKKPETRARRITKFVDQLARGEKPYP